MKLSNQVLLTHRGRHLITDYFSAKWLAEGKGVRAICGDWVPGMGQALNAIHSIQSVINENLNVKSICSACYREIISLCKDDAESFLQSVGLSLPHHYENPYGDGYEEATKENYQKGDEVWKKHSCGWEKLHPDEPCFLKGKIYRRKIRLRIGENYRNMQGEETGPLTKNKTDRNPQEYPFYSEKLGIVYQVSGWSNYRGGTSQCIVTHLPNQTKKETRMKPSDYSIKIHEHLDDNRAISVTEAARLYLESPEVRAEVKRAEEEKKIKVGDWAGANAEDLKIIFKVTQNCQRLGFSAPTLRAFPEEELIKFKSAAEAAAWLAEQW